MCVSESIHLGRRLNAGILMVFLSEVVSAPVPAPATPVIVAEVKWHHSRTASRRSGTLRANESVLLTASVTETVTVLHFDDGDRVEQGAILAEMTSNEEHALLEEAKALSAEAERQYRRVKSLGVPGHCSQVPVGRAAAGMADRARALIAIESRLIRSPDQGAFRRCGRTA